MPTTIISSTTKTLRTRSAMVRPASTAERDMGRDRNRNRSMMPLLMSWDRPTAVEVAPNTTVCTMTPGIRKST
jgi:hypothetical protein